MNSDGSMNYHCFNCKYKASYQPGRHLTFKFRKLLEWFGSPESEIKRLVIEAIRVKDFLPPEKLNDSHAEKIEFKKRSLPEDVKSFNELVTFYELQDWQSDFEHLRNAVQYCSDRKIDLRKYTFYLSDIKANKLDKRVIIPFYWEDEIIGYTARAIEDLPSPFQKYYGSHEPNFVFNLNNQDKDWKFVIVCEGPFDAMSIDGVAVLGSEISEQQADIIDSLGREVIVVADKDKAGASLITSAIKYGWNVSFPIWQEECKDINEAVVKYGKLFVLKSIIDAKETNKLKIELKRRMYN